MHASEELSSVLREDLFPGNAACFENARVSIKENALVGFVGSGVSVPLFPSWTGLLFELVRDAKKSGLIKSEEDLKFLEDQITSDPLECASWLEETYTKHVFRAKIGDIFASKARFTSSHELVIRLGLKGFLTLNYDDGLELAFARNFSSLPKIIRSQDRSEIAKWTQNRLFNTAVPPILHWHGIPSSPDAMVLTSDDYNMFYSGSENVDFVRELWRNNQLLIVGFGFSDPFLIRVAEAALRNLETGSRHFALIGRKGDTPVSPMERRQFARRFRVEPIIYQVRVGESGVGEDHSDLQVLLRHLRGNEPVPQLENNSSKGAGSDVSSKLSHGATFSYNSNIIREFEKHLFVSLAGKQLYVDPILVKHSDPVAESQNLEEEMLSIDELVKADTSIVVNCGGEYGASTLCRSLSVNFTKGGAFAIHRSAEQLPSYKLKLQQEFEVVTQSDAKHKVLLLDDYDSDRHERLLKELIGARIFTRFVVMLKTKSMVSIGGASTFNFGIPLIFLNLEQIRRPQIRSLATDVFNSSDSDLISGVVDKVYKDLLDLCIPLTPSNVIMYLSIIHREGDFHPLNRVQIVEKYILEMLRRPSDLFIDSFNAKNKIDVVSAFIYDLYSRNVPYASAGEWSIFCKNFMKSTLSYFDEKSLLAELLRERVFIKFGENLILKYKFFYAYFLGRYVANRQKILTEFINNDSHIALDVIVEVISATASDNTLMIEKLTTQLSSHLQHFEEKYGLGNVDPFSDFGWPEDSNEEERVWRPMAERIEAGPQSTSEMDQVRRSILAERRTDDQSVAFKQFEHAERRMVAYYSALVQAVSNTDIMDGELKKAAIELLFATSMKYYQIGMLLAPVLARRYTYVWHGVLFDASIYREHDDADAERNSWRAFHIASSMAYTVIDVATSNLGTKRLSEVYKVIYSQIEPNSFQAALNFSLLLRSKPNNWSETAEEIVLGVDRKSRSLKIMLHSAFKQFHGEVNTNAEREKIKRLISIIRAKRDVNKKLPGNKLIARVIKQLDEKGYFDAAGKHD